MADPTEISFFTIDERRTRRLRVRIPGTVRIASGDHACEVLEISCSGALLSSSTQLEPGGHGLLRCDCLDILFNVVRMRGQHAAVQFEEAVQPAEGVFADGLDQAATGRLIENRRFFRRVELLHALPEDA